MSVERLVSNGPMQGWKIASPPEATHMAVRQVVLYHGSGQSSVVGPVLYRQRGGRWEEVLWTPAQRRVVPEQYEVHFFTES